MDALSAAKPWKEDPAYFKRVRISGAVSPCHRPAGSPGPCLPAMTQLMTFPPLCSWMASAHHGARKAATQVAKAVVVTLS